MSRGALVLVATAALVTTAAGAGCYRTRFELMPPTPSTPSGQYTNHFHFSLINIIELSSPIDLVRACGGAPVAYIYEDTGILGSIANAFLGYVIPILHVKNATVYCAYAGGTPMVGAPQ